jgi:hypothetical protein
MGMLFKAYLSGPKIWSCERCGTHLTSHDDLVSKQFHGRHGRAYLFSHAYVTHSSSSGLLASSKPSRSSADESSPCRSSTFFLLPAFTSNSVNVSLGEKEPRELITGMHVVADLFCNVCESVVGWKYLEAHEADQKYKVGLFIIERTLILKDKAWE